MAALFKEYPLGQLRLAQVGMAVHTAQTKKNEGGKV